MELVINYTLLLVSGAACVYCFVLSKRLKRLNDTREGLGASIVEMSSALSQTQQTLKLAREASIEGIEKLTALIEEAERKAPEMAEMLDALDAITTLATEDIEDARARALQAIDLRAAAAGDIAAERDAAARSVMKPSKKAAA